MRELAEQVLKDAQDFNFNDEIIAELNEGIYSINDELADRRMDLGIKRLRGIEKNEMKPFHSKSSSDATHISSLIQVYISFDEMKRFFMEKHYI
jgi:hypothetical protein